MAMDVGLHENTIYTWVAKYRKNSVKPFVGSGHVKVQILSLANGTVTGIIKLTITL
ncbi:MAG: hypothetical protein Q8942_17915 [Bacillota bacterium]|nr:hypothetical protein [Bacillota bacterium]